MKKNLLSSLFRATNEKQKDYRNLVLIEIVIIVLGLTLSEFLLEGTSTPTSKFVITIFSFFGVLYAFLLWDLLRNFTTSKRLIRIYLIVLIATIGTGILGEFPYYTILDIPNRPLYLLIIHTILFAMEVTVISFAIGDLFSGEYLTPDKLWGAACVFLMTGQTFGSLFDLICIMKPGSLGTNTELGFANYSQCVTYSMGILGGMDPGFPNVSTLIRNISILEAVWSNLFVVLIIGKLMGLPRPPKEQTIN